MKLLCLTLLLSLSLSLCAQLRSNSLEDKTSYHATDEEDEEEEKEPVRPVDLLKDGFDKPPWITLPDNANYLEAGKGCDPSKQPDWAKEKNANESYYATEFNVEGWSGFCQANLTTCPDAIINKDYLYYARAKGQRTRVLDMHHEHDKEYCQLNGWLKPNVSKLVNDFKALQAFGKEECKKGERKYMMQTQMIGDAILSKQNIVGKIADAKGQSIESKTFGAGVGEAINMAVGAMLFPFPNAHKAMLDKKAHQDDIVFMDEEIAELLAAWTCAMGDLACDIAYCNYAYCEVQEGAVGVAIDGSCNIEKWDYVMGALSGKQE